MVQEHGKIELWPRWLVVLAAIAVLLPLLGAVTPSSWLHGLAARLEHSGDLTPDRLLRFRLVFGLLFLAHAALGAWVLLRARGPVAEVGNELRSEQDSVGPVAAARRIIAWLTAPGTLHVLCLVVILAAGTYKRLGYLTIPMDYDEAYSFLNYARRPLYQGLADYNSTNNHLLNTLFMHTSFQAFGQQEWALRLHVFAAGSALIGFTYIVARTMISAEAAIVAAALVAASDVLVNYSVNARGYVLVAWFTIQIILASWRLGEREVQPLAVDWLAAAVAAVLGLFAMPIMIYAIVGCTGWLGWQFIRRGPAGRAALLKLVTWTILSAVCTLWLYAPALVYRGIEAWQHRFVAPQDWRVCLARTPAAWFIAVKSWSEGSVPWQATAVFGLVGLVCLWFTQRRALGLIGTVLGATFVVMCVQRVTPPPRIFAFLAPAFAVLAAAAVDAITRLVGMSPNPAAGRSKFATPGTLCSAFACAVVAWSFATARQELPGGLHPSFLVEDVGVAMQTASQPAENQLWRLSVPEAVDAVERELYQVRPARVLVALPIDLPFHYYSARRGSTLPIGGQPQPGEHVVLVARGGHVLQTVLRENLSIQTADPRVINANWRLVAFGDLSIWRASLAAEPATESVSP